MFVEVTGDKLVGGHFCPPSWIGLKGVYFLINFEDEGIQRC